MERNVMGELSMHRAAGTKPNFSDIARRHGLDRHTVAKYWKEGGEVEDRNGRSYRLRRSDTLYYNVASMTTFLDERTRYMQRIVLRDAEANARFFFTFPVGKSSLVDTLPENRRQIAAVKSPTRKITVWPRS